mmetsp:Transcript_33114/g.59875  ORF Transcript_33114/g.59875 Transcript_33114/m.59875 type:complete len:347 (+) Transcript_33114:463-1503(+)
MRGSLLHASKACEINPEKRTKESISGTSGERKEVAKLVVTLEKYLNTSLLNDTGNNLVAQVTRDRHVHTISGGRADNILGLVGGAEGWVHDFADSQETIGDTDTEHRSAESDAEELQAITDDGTKTLGQGERLHAGGNHLESVIGASRKDLGQRICRRSGSLVGKSRGRNPCKHKIGDDSHHGVGEYKVSLLNEVLLTLGVLSHDLHADPDAKLNSKLDGERGICQKPFTKTLNTPNHPSKKRFLKFEVSLKNLGSNLVVKKTILKILREAINGPSSSSEKLKDCGVNVLIFTVAGSISFATTKTLLSRATVAPVTTTNVSTGLLYSLANERLAKGQFNRLRATSS